MKSILINSSIFFDQVAVLEDGKLIDYIHEEKDNKKVIGNIYKGKVMNILPGMDAAFIDIGFEKNAYLFLDDLLSDKFLKEKKLKKRDVDNINKVLKKGDELLVQIIREPIGEKNISVTTDISLTGKHIAFIPYSTEVNISKKIKDNDERNRLEQIGKEIMKDGNGMIIRTFAKGCMKEDMQKEYNMLSSIFKKIEKQLNYSYAPKLLYENNSFIEKLFYDYVDNSVKEIFVEDKVTKDKIVEMITGYPELSDISIIESDSSFEKYNIEKQIGMLFDRKVDLDNGGSIFIDVTEAMTVIDVNSGSFVGSENIENTALTINLYALDEIKRQINLRNISGIIIIDFIDVKNKENVNLIVNKAKTIFKEDKIKTNVIGMTKLNLMELTRKKDSENFYNLITEECEHCSGSGRTSSNVYIFLKIEGIIKNVKKHTSSEAIILKTGSVLYYKILNECMDIIKKIEQKYNIKIYIIKDNSILTDEIIVDRTGKLNYISMYVK